MLGPFFKIAAVSPGRRQALATAVLIHLLLFAVVPVRMALAPQPDSVVLPLGLTLLLAAIVEGAFLIGWRLTQLPRSQSMEFLLVSPVQPVRVYLSEVAVGLARLAFVTLSGLPILVFLAATGRLFWVDVAVFTIMPFTWGAITGLGLVQWAYEPKAVRKWAERFLGLAVLLYLFIGVVIGENLRFLVGSLPGWLGTLLLEAFEGFHRNNPFAVMGDWCRPRPWQVWPRLIGLQLFATALLVLVIARAALRLKGHFQDRHYSQKEDRSWRGRGRIGDRPLSWWAIKRVMEYAGRTNLYLAGGFGLIYAAYVMLGSQWPAWLGKRAFQVVDVGMGGVPGFSTGLVVLAAVPAAFQYGLWDSSVQERCKRLELLLISELNTTDYLLAALAAAWRRGSGYLWVALLLWVAGAVGGRLHWSQVGLALVSSLVLLALYFALGFWSFVRGLQANGLGSLLTLGLPMLVIAFAALGPRWANWLLPPGAVFASQTLPASPLLLLNWALYGGFAAWLFSKTLRRGESWLRQWYDANQGKKADAAV